MNPYKEPINDNHYEQLESPTMSIEATTIYIDIKFSTMVMLIIKFFFAMIAACIVMFFFGAILAAAIPAMGEFFNAIYTGWILGQLS